MAHSATFLLFLGLSRLVQGVRYATTKKAFGSREGHDVLLLSDLASSHAHAKSKVILEIPSEDPNMYPLAVNHSCMFNPSGDGRLCITKESCSLRKLPQLHAGLFDEAVAKGGIIQQLKNKTDEIVANRSITPKEVQDLLDYEKKIKGIIGDSMLSTDLGSVDTGYTLVSLYLMDSRILLSHMYSTRLMIPSCASGNKRIVLGAQK